VKLVMSITMVSKASELVSHLRFISLLK